MNPTRGYYCLIQYCPDPSRLEAANVGVLLFCPERKFLRARAARGNDRIRRFFGSTGMDWDQINIAKRAFVERIHTEANRVRTLADLEQFQETRHHELVLTPPRPMKVFSPDQDLQFLFDRLVGGRDRPDSLASFIDALAETFRRHDLQRYLREEVTVVVPVFQKPLTLPFAYRREQLHLIRPVCFFGATQAALAHRACKYAVEGRLLRGHPDPMHGETRLVVVARFPNDGGAMEAMVRSVFAESEVPLYAARSLEPLLDDIRSSEVLHAPF